MKAIVKNTRIAGICTAVPKDKINFFDSPDMFPPDEIARLFANTGIGEIRVAPDKMIVSDMCTAAAEHLLKKLGWEKSSIELIVLITQGPDVPLPATACLIQNRMGLPTTCAAFDVNLGCSGYVYGLWMVSQLLASMQAGRALLMVGDKSTGGVKPGDRATVSLFGDAGAVTAIERCEDENPVYYVAGTDGKGAAHLNLTAGRDRYPIPIIETALPKDDYERWMNASKIHLVGAEVFGFTIRVVPGLIRDTLALAGVEMDQVDNFVFHQANKFILEHLGRKMKLPEGRSLLDLEKWGNTSSASIPLTICTKLGETLKTQSKKLCVAGFGVGWSWAAAVLDVGPIPFAEIYEIPDDFPCGSDPL
jgi:3-oxoacyl-[acyl-carrier-protein] synthase-3